MPSQITKIFCPFDLSVETFETLNFAFALASDFSAHLTIFVYYPPHTIENPEPVQRKFESRIREATNYFRHKQSKPIFEIRFQVVAANEAAQVIVEEAAGLAANLIVVQSSDSQLIFGLPSGLLARIVCRYAPCPVIVVRPKEPPTFKSLKLKRVLAAYDFSSDSDHALQDARILSEKYGSELHLLHVLAEPPDAVSKLFRSEQISDDLYHRTMQRLCLRVDDGERIHQKIIPAVRWGKPYQEILDYAEEQEIDLIALGANGSDFGARSLFGSNSSRIMLNRASCSLLIARPLKPKLFFEREITRPAA